LKTDVNVPLKNNKQKTFEKSLLLLSSCQPLKKKQDPDLQQHVTNPQHWFSELDVLCQGLGASPGY
jgi:hypothetical protein